jgi:hypothetical protein
MTAVGRERTLPLSSSRNATVVKTKRASPHRIEALDDGRIPGLEALAIQFDAHAELAT